MQNIKQIEKPVLSFYEQQKQEALSRAAFMQKTEALAKIIKPLRTAIYEADYSWRNFKNSFLDRADYGPVDLMPDFQRGHVWTPEQQKHFIENALRGLVPSSGFFVQFNCPNWEDCEYQGGLPLGMQCVDGLQRITAVQAFISGELLPFGLHVDDLAFSAFSAKSNYQFRVAIHNFQSRAELLRHYLDLNAGGTPHGEVEIARVKQLLTTELA